MLAERAHDLALHAAMLYSQFAGVVTAVFLIGALIAVSTGAFMPWDIKEFDDDRAE